MTKSTTGEQQSTDQANEAMPLSEAVRIVQEAIAESEARLRQVANSEENDPVILEGETTTGYYVHMMVDPAKIAKIMLDYWYPVYWILEEEAPQGMWDDMAEMVGLKNVAAVDLKP